nr:MAG TPA: Repressor protein CI [Caudoviricetes sp.]
MDFLLNTDFLKEKMKEKKIRYADLAIDMTNAGYPITESSIKKWFMKDPIIPDLKNMVAIAKVLKLDVNDVILQNLFSNSKENTFLIPKSEMRIGAGSEGVYDLEMLQKDERKIAVDKAFLKGLDTKHLRIFEVVGDSMEPDFYEGDWAIADMVAGRGEFVRIAGVYIVRVDDVVYIKRVEFLPQNKIKLISLNPKYSDMYPHKEGYECEILGKVCGKVHCEVYKGLTFEDYGIK